MTTNKLIPLLSTLLLATHAKGDIEINLSFGSIYSAAKGEMIYAKEFWKSSLGKIDHKNASHLYGRIECKSSNKLLPTLLLSFIDQKTQGNSYIHLTADDPLINTILNTLDEQLGININDRIYASRLAMRTYDLTLYYELYKAAFRPSLRFGIDVKHFEFDYAVILFDGFDFNDFGSGTAPMIYLGSKWDIKKNKKSRLTIGLEARQYIFGPSTIYDYKAEIDMMMRYNKNTTLGVEMGYRAHYFHIRGDDIDTVGGHIDTSGVYL